MAQAGRGNWFKMLSKRRSSESGDVVIKEGCLTKSPPPSYILFNNRTSWKERIHKLCKTFDGSYVIRYYAHDEGKEVWKGDIAVSSIKSIELGKASMDRIASITQLLKIAPENVLCINTTKRTYYFVDNNQENIVEWQKSITDAWVEINRTNNEAGPRIAHPVPLNEDLSLTKCNRELKRGLAVYRQPHNIYENPEGLRDELPRPNSYPQDNSRTDSDLAGAKAAVRQRSHTDPQQRSEITANNRTERLGTLEKIPEWKMETYPEETTIKKEEEKPLTLPLPSQDDTDSCGCRLSGDSTDVDTAYNSDPGSPIYDVPRPFSMANVSLGSTEEEDSDSDEDVYMPMGPANTGTLVSREDPQMPIDQSQEDTDDLRQDQQMPTDQSQEGTDDLSEQQDSSDYVATKITVPTLYLKNYFDIQEVGERLCVSKWKGPVEIGCLFHHGDHIDAINGVRPGTKDFFMQMLNNSITEMVNLRIIRNKKAGVFHLPGCNCGNS